MPRLDTLARFVSEAPVGLTFVGNVGESEESSIALEVLNTGLLQTYGTGRFFHEEVVGGWREKAEQARSLCLEALQTRTPRILFRRKPVDLPSSAEQIRQAVLSFNLQDNADVVLVKSRHGVVPSQPISVEILLSDHT